MNQIQTIDEVIECLDQIIQTSKESQSPDGYFAALYRKVTLEVKKGIEEGFFEDGSRMETLDVIFAKRYIDAYHEFHKDQPVTAAWRLAFEASKNKNLIVLQHLLLGMNAHISLDLGIAAVETMIDQPIEALHDDFNKINEVLSNLVDDVQRDLCQIWPALTWILKFAGKLDDKITDFSMKLARDGAWRFATNLSEMPPDQAKEFIKARDQKVTNKASIVTHPGFFVSMILKFIRWGEKGTIAQKIADLQD